MKTTNNVQKTNLKSVIFVAGLIVMGFSVDGQAATKLDVMNDNNNQLAFASVKVVPSKKTSTGTGATASLAAYLAPAAEEALTIEKWMTEENRFDGTVSIHEKAAKTNVEPESRITDEKNFNVTGKKQTTAKTASFEISTSKFVYREVINEEELRIEPWMIDPKIWK